MITLLKEKYQKVFFKFSSYILQEKKPQEKEGVEYFCISENEFKEIESQGKSIIKLIILY